MRISDWSSDVCSSDLKLLDRRAELQREDESVVADRAPVALDQESVGRLSRIDAMQVQAMALAQQRRRQSERNAIDAALLRIDEEDRKSTRLNYSHYCAARMQSSA